MCLGNIYTAVKDSSFRDETLLRVEKNSRYVEAESGLELEAKGDQIHLNMLRRLCMRDQIRSYNRISGIGCEHRSGLGTESVMDLASGLYMRFERRVELAAETD